MRRYYFHFIIGISFIIRCIYGYFSLYNCDQTRVFDLGYQIYKFHILPTQGSPVVYTNSLLPGSLQSILAAIPLYFSGGHPFSIIVFAQILNLISCIIIYKIYNTLFPSISKYFMLAFIVLNPMNIVWSYGWNPSFMILFSTLFFLGVVKIIHNKYDKFALFLVLFPHLLILQLNLQFLILAVALIILIFRKIIPMPSFKILFYSLIPGIITFLPYAKEKIFGQHIKTNNWNMNGNLLGNIDLNFSNILSYPHILARFISFSTGETTRSLGEGFIKNHIWIYPFLILGMLGVTFIFIIAAFFYLDKNKWACFFNNTLKFTTFEKLDLVLIYLPIISTFLFVFSVTPPTTHKIWIMFPFCFYPFFRILTQYEYKIKSILYSVSIVLYRIRFKLFAIYLFCALLYSTIGAAYLQPNFANVYKGSVNFCKAKSLQDVNEVLKTVDPGSKEYAMAMLCQYWMFEL